MLSVQENLSRAKRKGFGPDAGSNVNFEWPLWLKLSTPSSLLLLLPFFLLPKPPGCLCMTSSPNYAPHTHVNLSCHNHHPPITTTAPPLNCTAPQTPYVSFSPSSSLSLFPLFFFYHQSPPFFFFFFFNPQKGIV